MVTSKGSEALICRAAMDAQDESNAQTGNVTI